MILYEIGYKPWEIDLVLYRDYNMIIAGYYRSQEREANLARNIMWYIKAFGGMGSTDAGLPKDIWALNMDLEDEKQMITNIKMAIELLKEF